jgi:hypothetical protein
MTGRAGLFACSARCESAVCCTSLGSRIDGPVMLSCRGALWRSGRYDHAGCGRGAVAHREQSVEQRYYDQVAGINRGSGPVACFESAMIANGFGVRPGQKPVRSHSGLMQGPTGRAVRKHETFRLREARVGCIGMNRLVVDFDAKFIDDNDRKGLISDPGIVPEPPRKFPAMLDCISGW